MPVKKNNYITAKRVKYTPSNDRINKFILPTHITGKKYYLYVHIRLDKDEIFYFGIGTIDRNKNYYRSVDIIKRNIIWKRIVDKTKLNVFIIDESDTKEDILKREIQYISLMGKKCNKTGTLANLTDGGESLRGHKIVWTKEMRDKLSKATSARVIKDSTREKYRQNIYNSNLIGRKGADSYIARATLKIDIISGNILEEFPSIKAAADSVLVKHQSIGNAIKKGTQSKGYLWRIKDGC